MNRLKTLTFMIICAGGIAVAHGGVKNPAVMARMETMTAIGAEMKTLGAMAKGAMAFDAFKARASAATIASHAAAIIEQFRAQESDPKSEAKPLIWSNFDDFSTHAKALELAAQTACKSVETQDDLGQALAALGGTCKACHEDYRE